MAAGEKAAVGVRIFVDADGQDGQVGLLVVQFEQRGHLLHAGRAPGRPEVEQHHLAAIAGQMDRGRAVGDGEIRGRLAGLGRMRAAVAARRKRQRQQQSERENPREPHISYNTERKARSERWSDEWRMKQERGGRP